MLAIGPGHVFNICPAASQGHAPEEVGAESISPMRADGMALTSPVLFAMLVVAAVIVVEVVGAGRRACALRLSMAAM